MGWLVNAGTNPQNNPAATGTVVLPTGVYAGLETYIFIWSTGTRGTSFTAPGGWSQVFDVDTGASLGVRAALYKRTFVNGDTNPTFTHPSPIWWLSFCIKSDQGSYSVQTNQTNTGSTDPVVVKPFSPATSAADLRLLFYLVGNFGSIDNAVPAVTPSDANPSGKGFVEIREGALASGPNPNGVVYYSLWSDPSGADANNTNFTSGNSAHPFWACSLCLTDGSNHNGGGLADEEGLFQCTADPSAFTPEQAGQDQDSTNVNWWGGGAETMGDDGV